MSITDGHRWLAACSDWQPASCMGSHRDGGEWLQVAAARHIRESSKKAAQGRAKLGVEAFAEALLGVPKILAENSGFDAQVPHHDLHGKEFTA